MKYIYSTSQISKLSLTLCTFSATDSVAGLFLTIIKSNHIFNNIVVVSKPYIIKVSPKSDIAIIWLDI